MDILIADDDSTILTMLEGILSRNGYDVVTFEDGNDAYRRLSAPDGPPMALIDWEMPGTRGPTLIRRLRELDHGAALYLIMLTARGGREDLLHGLEAGADDFVRKPFDTMELCARIEVGRRVLELQRKMQERERMRGVLEMAGAVCHELNQPLQSASGYARMLLSDTPRDDQTYDMLTRLTEDIDRIGWLTRKIMGISTHRAKSYMGRQRIIDILESAPDVP